MTAVDLAFFPSICMVLKSRGNGLHVRVAMQVCGNVKLPLPAAQYDFSSSNDGVTGSLCLGEGALEVNIAQINPVLYV